MTRKKFYCMRLTINLNTLKTNNWFVFFVFICITFFLRISSFFQSVINWDESLYLLMASSILDGHIPYSVVWDIKPPGIYVLFSLAQILFGHSISSIRIITCIA